jgi:hypothetical protein
MSGMRSTQEKAERETANSDRKHPGASVPANVDRREDGQEAGCLSEKPGQDHYPLRRLQLPSHIDGPKKMTSSHENSLLLSLCGADAVVDHTPSL